MENKWIGGWGSGVGDFSPAEAQGRRGAEGNEVRRRLLGRGAFEGKIKKPRAPFREAGL
jgi:hypothetical protein